MLYQLSYASPKQLVPYLIQDTLRRLELEGYK